MCSLPSHHFRLQVTDSSKRDDFWGMVRKIRAEGWSKFWYGLEPALILSCNPAINYAAFDTMKAVLLRTREELHGRDIAVLGITSKFLATIVTYPLIRAKVIMMAGADKQSPRALQMEGDDKISGLGNDDKGNSHDEEPQLPRAYRSPRLLRILAEIVRSDGAKGLYIGMDAQVVNTALKNALLLLSKEHIERLAHVVLRQILYGLS